MKTTQVRGRRMKRTRAELNKTEEHLLSRHHHHHHKQADCGVGVCVNIQSLIGYEPITSMDTSKKHTV